MQSFILFDVLFFAQSLSNNAYWNVLGIPRIHFIFSRQSYSIQIICFLFLWANILLEQWRMARIRICFIVTSQLAFVIFLLSLTGFSIHYHNRSICFQVERIFQYYPKHPGMVRWNKRASCSQGTHKLFFQSKYPENILKLKKNPNKPW